MLSIQSIQSRINHISSLDQVSCRYQIQKYKRKEQNIKEKVTPTYSKVILDTFKLENTFLALKISGITYIQTSNLKKFGICYKRNYINNLSNKKMVLMISRQKIRQVGRALIFMGWCQNKWKTIGQVAANMTIFFWPNDHCYFFSLKY